MYKKFLLMTSIFVFTFVIAMPVYAQTPTPTPNSGLLGQIESFFSGLFHHNRDGQGQEQQNPNVTPGSGQDEQGNMMPNPSGQPTFQTMQQRRLSYLVQQGKITQTQADAILAEQEKVQAELKAWADAEGINESYVLGGLVGEEISGQGHGFQQGTVSNTSQQSQTQQFHPMMHNGQESQGGEEGGQSGFQQGNGGVPSGAQQGQ